MLEYLVAQGFGIEDVGGAGASALFVAATENRMDNVVWLVEHGADVNATDRQGGPLFTHALSSSRHRSLRSTRSSHSICTLPSTAAVNISLEV